jgi:hypothetical protein
MPNYTTTGDGSGQLESLGNQFQNFMLQLAEMKARQRAEQDMHNYRQASLDLQRQEQETRAPLIGAQTEHFGSETKLNLARQAALDALQESGQNAGLGAFGQAMVGTEGYDPNQTSFLANTPENQSRLMEAIIAQQLTQNAASSPAGAEGLMKPVELNKDTDLVNPRTGKKIASGPVSPKTRNLRNVTDGGELIDADTGNLVWANKKETGPGSDRNNLPYWTSLFRGATDTMQTLGKEDALGGRPFESDPNLGMAYTNSADMVKLLAPLILKQLRGGTNETSTATAPAVPAVGEVRKGYKFKGGDPAQKANWEKVQ